MQKRPFGPYVAQMRGNQAGPIPLVLNGHACNDRAGVPRPQTDGTGPEFASRACNSAATTGACTAMTQVNLGNAGMLLQHMGTKA